MQGSVENEWLCSRLMQRVGLNTARCEILEFGKRKALAVERFDRRLQRAGWIARLSQEDFCQALGLPNTMKYESDGGPGMRDILRVLDASLVPLEDKRAFLKAQMVFWLLAANSNLTAGMRSRKLPALAEAPSGGTDRAASLAGSIGPVSSPFPNASALCSATAISVRHPIQTAPALRPTRSRRATLPENCSTRFHRSPPDLIRGRIGNPGRAESHPPSRVRATPSAESRFSAWSLAFPPPPQPQIPA